MTAMPKGKQIEWTEAANLTVEGAPEELQLWAWAQEQRDQGVSLNKLGQQIGCAGTSVRKAIEKHSPWKASSQPSAAPPPPVPLPTSPALAPEPDPDFQPIAFRLAEGDLSSSNRGVLIAFIEFMDLGEAALYFAAGWKERGLQPVLPSPN
jgi:hypothetical protein